MVMKRSRREFIIQASVMVAGSRVFLRSAWGAQTQFVVADTAFGRIRGADIGGIKTFKGIPYGANTAGKNRFMPPVNPSKWAGVQGRAGIWTERPAE